MELIIILSFLSSGLAYDKGKKLILDVTWISSFSLLYGLELFGLVIATIISYNLLYKLCDISGKVESDITYK